MKELKAMISVITVCYNSQETIRDTIESVLIQDYINVEHIIIDGGSTDSTLSIVNEYQRKELQVVSEPDEGIYDAINKGIALSNGSVISILNSDDHFVDKTVLSQIMGKFALAQDVDCVLCGVDYFRGNKQDAIVRRFGVKYFHPLLMRIGIMPPHPGSFFKSNVYNDFGTYDLSFQICGDFDFFVRVILKNRITYTKIHSPVVKMKLGGVSTRGIKSFAQITNEFNSSLRKHGYISSVFFLWLRLPIRLIQLRVF